MKNKPSSIHIIGRRAILTTLIASAFSVSAEESANPAAAMDLPDMDVIGTTPTHGVGLPLESIPANIQSATAEDLERSQSLDLSEYMNRNLGSVNINDAQNNPLQSDVQYRGFSASPLLGLPQGLAVYQNGVRINEAFGDTVNWDVIPKSAIRSINLIGGASPLFGLNTLGGALSIETKNGFTSDQDSVEASFGSFGRFQTSMESAGNNGTFGYFITASFFEENGWRDLSDSDATNLFGTLSWRSENSTLDLNLAHGDTHLQGNGSSPVELLAIDREAVFTAVDVTENDMNLIDLEGTHWMNDTVQLSGNIFYRWNDTNSFNGDGTAFEDCEDVGLLFQEDDIDPEAGGDDEECDVAADHAGADPIEDQNGLTVDEDFNAINNISQRDQRSYGGSLQATFLQDLFQHENQLILGAGYFKGTTNFASQIEIAELLESRLTTRTGRFIPEDRVQVDTSTSTWSLYFTDTFGLSDTLDLTLSGRYNKTNVKVQDLTGLTPDLNGDHDFGRFNPAVGLTWQALENVNVYTSYSESSRAPTPVELSCADPDAPCTLPNAFLADPPLDQVVAKGVEAGLRGNYAGMVNWNLGLFHTINKDDIIFQSTGGTTGNEGFFDNIGDTKRQGVELGLNGDLGQINWFLNYSYVKATFDADFITNSPTHPQADDNGLIQVSSGDRIPGIPDHTLKLGADYAFSDAFSLGADLVYNTGQYLRGDEANLLDKTDSYTVVNIHANYKVNKMLSVFARVNNLFDTDYETFGILGEPDEVFDGSSPGFSPAMDDPRFLGAGAPIGGWIGVRVNF